MESSQQTLSNSNASQGLGRSDLGYIFLSGFALLIVHSILMAFSYSLEIPMTDNDYESWYTANSILSYAIYIGVGIIDLLVVLLIIWLPVWHKPKSFKAAGIAFGSCLLTILGFILWWVIGILLDLPTEINVYQWGLYTAPY